jgi:chemotaxis protein methyltransferase CheR
VKHASLSPDDSGVSALPVGATLDLPEFRAIAAIMHRDARIHLAEGKVTLVRSRLARRLREHGLADFRDYVALVERDQDERAVMVASLTTNHTHFFRENHHFDHLREHVLPGLQARARAGQSIRLWSAGSSTGEEVYSLAMTLAGEDRAAAAWLNQGDVKLLATDLAPHAVAGVRDATYPAATVEPIPPAYRRQWLRSEGDDFAVVDELRRLVTARPLNLFEPWPMRQRYDVIFCRNVMIYFEDEAKAELEARFVEMLAPGGYLYIGHSERLIGPAASAMQPVAQTAYVKVAA